MGIVVDKPYICPACGKLWYVTGDTYYYELEHNSIVHPCTERHPTCPHCEVPLDEYPFADPWEE